MVLDRGHRLLFILGSLTPAFSSQGSQPHGAPVPSGRKKKLRGIFISFLCTYIHRMWWRLLAVFVMGPSGRQYTPSFLNYKGKSRASLCHKLWYCGISSIWHCMWCSQAHMNMWQGEDAPGRQKLKTRLHTGRAKQVVHHLKY